MRTQRSSATAEWVAVLRGFAWLLPPGAQLAIDPYGALFASPAMRKVTDVVERWPLVGRALGAHGPLYRAFMWLQLRTRALDDVALSFVQQGGGQIVLLGAGFDTRALRLREPLRGARVYEVDHPATQARKRQVLAELGAHSAAAKFVACDFEEGAIERLSGALAQAGLDRARPTLAIWEGVTPYLSEAAIDATVAMFRTIGAAGSLLAFTYFERSRVESAEWRRLVALFGEPYRFGWDPAALPDWLAARGLGLESDRTDGDLASVLLPPTLAARYRAGGRHVAVARSTAEP